MFCDCVPVNPELGASSTGTIAFFTADRYTDPSKLNRSPKKPASKPPSISVDFSGPNFTLPGLCGSSAGVAAYTAMGRYVWNESNGPGAFPAVPRAARSLRLLTCLGSHEYRSRLYARSTFGYVW